MIDFLKEKESFDSLKTCVQTGNFRRMFFEKEKTFYRALATKEIFSYFENKGTTVLYAPTWQDYENSSSFFDAAPILIDNLPSHFNLIVKLHPNAVIQDTHRIEQLIWKYEDRTNVLFLIDFPPIYPLLECVDIYIGDMSSIGYDFLSFNRPMFFLNQNRRDPKEDPGLYLYRCGVEIRPEQYADIYKIIDIHLPTDHLVFSEIRKEVYDYTFASGKTWEGLKEEISEACNAIADDDLIFM
jgi:CDP-glycerol glycerophosphotransferase (TagB/SpsB family)